MLVISGSMLVAPLLRTHRYLRTLFTFIAMNMLFIFCCHVFSNPIAAALLAPVGLGPPLTTAAAMAVVSIALLVPFNLTFVRRFIPELIGVRQVPATAAASRAT